MLSNEGQTRPDGFIVVGKPAPIGEVLVSYEHADELKKFVTSEYFEYIQPKTPELTEISDKSVAAKGFHSIVDQGNNNDPSMFSGALLRHIDDSSWRLIVMLTRMRRSDYNLAPQRVEERYNFHVFGGDLYEATKQIRVTRGLGELTLDMVESGVEPELVRKMYERPVTEEDCRRVREKLSRAVKRAQI